MSLSLPLHLLGMVTLLHKADITINGTPKPKIYPCRVGFWQTHSQSRQSVGDIHRASAHERHDPKPSHRWLSVPTTCAHTLSGPFFYLGKFL
ncbi:MAG: hypothetical protein Q3971_00820 [Moraxella sp.]|nr:hypothetical protein [Moraxella sp.]